MTHDPLEGVRPPDTPPRLIGLAAALVVLAVAGFVAYVVSRPGMAGGQRAVPTATPAP